MSIHYINNGSLTSIFTPASSCLATILDGSTFRLPGQESSAGCFPSRLGLYRVRQTAAFFSPGRCPASYTAYTVTTVLSLAPSEHVYNCCPLNLTVDAAADRGCRSSWTESTSITYSVYDRIIGTIGPARTTTITDNFPRTFDAYSMQIRFRDSDISALNLKGSELTALGLGAVTRTTSSATDFTSVTTATSSSTSASTSSMVPTGGLSTGARVAIGVVIPTVLISLCVGIYLYFRRRRIRESNSRNVQAMSALHEIRGGAVEAHGSARHEADGRIVQPQHYELDSVQLIEVEARS